MMREEVEAWSCEEVGNWLTAQGYPHYATHFANHHRVDGETLLGLSEEDLRRPPMAIPVLGDVKRLWSSICALQTVCKAPLDPAGPVLSRSEPNLAPSPSVAAFLSSHDFERILIAKVEAPDTPTKSVIKTLIAFIYCSLALLVTAFVMVIVHDRVPDMKTYPPLPDLFLDNVPLISWAFEVCEMIAMTMMLIWALVLLFHRSRVILMSRMFALTGTVFLLRCITMLITSLSVPGVHLECASKQHDGFSAKFHQAIRIWVGMGMSLKGVRSCGDYMFSGHTTVLTLLNHFITEYTPDSWHYLHTTTWVLNLFGIFFILAGHEHYSIDVFVAFYISSRMFLYYHSMANQEQRDARTRMWFPLFWFFESGRFGPVPHEFHLPLPSLRWLCDSFHRLRPEAGLEPGSPKPSPKATPKPKNDMNEKKDPSPGDRKGPKDKRRQRHKNGKGD